MLTKNIACDNFTKRSSKLWKGCCFLFTLALNEKFPFKRKADGNGIKLETNEMGMFLCLYYKNPSANEIWQIKNYAITLYFTNLKSILNCVIQIEDDFLGEASYFSPLYRTRLSIKEMSPKQIFVCLIDADSQILRSMRIIGLPNEMTDFLYKVILAQQKSLITEDEYDEFLYYMEQHFSVSDLANMSDCAVVIRQDNKIRAFMR